MRDQELYEGAEAAQLKYEGQYAEQWGEHPRWTMEDWRLAVQEQETRIGYWAWVHIMIQLEGE